METLYSFIQAEIRFYRVFVSPLSNPASNSTPGGTSSPRSWRPQMFVRQNPFVNENRKSVMLSELNKCLEKMDVRTGTIKNSENHC